VSAPDDLRRAGVVELAAALERGETTSVELVELYSGAADRLDPVLGTYLARFGDEAHRAAEELDAERAAGRVRGVLHGIPIGVKDIIATREGPTTAQSLALDPSWGEQGDAPVVARLRAAGVIPLGKTSTMEFAIGFPDRRLHRSGPAEPSKDPADADKPFPLPRNPWRVAHWTGGVGAEPGGYCGVTGHKPTFGLVPKNGCVPLGLTYDHIGPLARSATDCAALLTVMAGAHPGDSSSVERPAEDYLAGIGGGVRGLRIGVARAATVEAGACSDGIAACLDEALDALRSLGATVVDIDVPLWDELQESCFSGLFAEALAWHHGQLAAHWDRYGADTRRAIAQGALISAGDYVQIQRVRSLGKELIAAVFDEVDLIATPTTGTTAPAFAMSARENRLRSLFTPPWNSLGLPAVALPMGFDDGLPTSLQLAGPAFADARVLRAGAAFQTVTDWHHRTPPLW
jgi:aspartyl-tRNA(Asn)/glutamyl-tRNA(Gln) amidotransferase subunit A